MRPSGGPWRTSCAISGWAARSCPRRRKTRLKAVEEELASLAAKFDDNLLDATNAWALYVTDPRELAGIPDSVLADARAAAEADGREGWKLTLHAPCLWPVMSYADNRALRATMHRANATRASDLGASPAWDNGPAIRRLLLLRREAANILGYPNFAALSLVPKMAKNVDEVLAFLRDLARRARPYARARRRRAPRVRGRRARSPGPCAVGPRLRVGEAQGEEVLVLGTAGSPLLSGSTRCWRACSA